MAKSLKILVYRYRYHILLELFIFLFIFYVLFLKDTLLDSIKLAYTAWGKNMNRA